MNSEDPFYFAGEAAKCLGVTPITLRTWRDRGICDFGSIDPALADNPRARRRYSDVEVCQMAVALTFSRFSHDMESAFLSAGLDSVRAAIASVLNGTSADDLIVTVAGGGFMIEVKDWATTVAIPRSQWNRSIPTVWEARDDLFGVPSEFTYSVNVSAIARRVALMLSELDGEGGDE